MAITKPQINFAQQSRRGFTLIELMVVMVVIAIFFTLFIRLSTGLAGSDSIDSILQQQAEHFVNVSVVASDQAVLTGDPIGLVIIAPLQPPEMSTSWRYYWQLYRGGEWVETTEPLVANELSEGFELALTVEGEDIDFEQVKTEQDTVGTDKKVQKPLPSLIFYPGGEITPFQLTIYDGQEFEKQVFLTSERLGRVEWLESKEQLNEPLFSDNQQ